MQITSCDSEPHVAHNITFEPLYLKYTLSFARKQQILCIGIPPTRQGITSYQVNVIAFTSLLARRFILFRTFILWVSEVMMCHQIEKLRCTLKGSLGRYNGTVIIHCLFCVSLRPDKYVYFLPHIETSTAPHPFSQVSVFFMAFCWHIVSFFGTLSPPVDRRNTIKTLAGVLTYRHKQNGDQLLETLLHKAKLRRSHLNVKEKRLFSSYRCK